MTGHLVVPQDCNEGVTVFTDRGLYLGQVYEALVCRCVVLSCSFNDLYCDPDLISGSSTLSEATLQLKELWFC